MISSEGSVIRLLLLTERSDCHFFQEVGKLKVPIQIGHKRFEMEGNDHFVKMSDESDKDALFIFPGRQIITADGLEVCSLLSTPFVPDRQYSARSTIEHILKNGGTPALNWAPGKWFFERGKIVKNILNSFDPALLLIGDTSMRPTLWPTPSLMKMATEHGFRRIAGSDPLPFRGEEKYIGSYGFKISGIFDHKNPVYSMKSLLTGSNSPMEIIGRRSRPIEFLRRQIRIMIEKRKRT